MEEVPVAEAVNDCDEVPYVTVGVLVKSFVVQLTTMSEPTPPNASRICCGAS